MPPSDPTKTLTAWGLHLHSDLPIPGAQSATPTHPDLTVRLGPATLPPPFRELPPYQLSGQSLLFTAPGVARYRCDRGETLLVDPFPGADPELVSALLVSTALPAALWMRGDLVLHAAAAVLPGQSAAIALAGPSGSGKSTLLRRLLGHGAGIVADDTLRLRDESGAILANGLPGCIQHRILGSPHRTLHPVPLAQQLSQASLAAIYLAAPVPAPVQLRGAEALAALLRTLHRPLTPRLLGLEPTLLPRLAELALQVPIYSASFTGPFWDQDSSRHTL